MKENDGKGRVLIITQNFYPEVFGINDIVEDLVKRGFAVDVLTGLPNYPLGKFYEGYSFIKRGPKTYHGARLIRCGVFPRLKDSSLGICLNYASFPFFSFFHLFGLLFKKYNKIFVYEPSPIFQCIPAIILGAFKKVEKIIYVLDIWPDSVYSVVDIKNKAFRRILYKYCCRVYQKFDKVLVTSRGFKPQLESQGVHNDKIIYFPQWANDVFTDSIEENPLRTVYKDTFNIVFAGNIGIPQGLDIIIEAAKLCRNIVKLRWILVGDGDASDKLRKRIADEHLENIIIMPGRKPQNEVPYYYDIAGALLVALKNIPLFENIVPAKIQSYMASGKPVIAAVNGEAAQIIKEGRCGLVSPAEDTVALAENARMLAALSEQQLGEMGLSGKKYAENNFNKNKLMNKLEEILR